MRASIASALLVVSLLAATPTALAGEESDSVTAGEMDTYGEVGDACPPAVTTWEITLTLEDPRTSDSVSLSAQGGVGTAADVATGLRPTAKVLVKSNDACRPPTQVTGLLVVDTVDYTLTFEAV